MRRVCCAYLFPLFAILCAAFTPAALAQSSSANITAAEKLYAELATLPAQERQARLEAGARKEGPFNLIMGFRGTLATQHTALFRKQYPFINVAMNDMGSDQAVERMIAEETANRHLTDVISTISVAEITSLLDRSMVARYPTPAAQLVLPIYKEFLDPDQRWMPTHWSEQGISYNSRMLSADQAPKSWEDLCKPQYRKQVSMDPVRARFLAFLHKYMGEERAIQWMECMGKNAPIIHDGQTSRMTLMLAGDHAIQGGNFFYYGLTMQKKDPVNAPFQPVYEAAVLAAAGVAVINKNTPNPHASALYMDWVVSQGPQKYLSDNLRGPVALPHPFMPESVTLVTVGVTDAAIIDRMSGHWNRYIDQK